MRLAGAYVGIGSRGRKEDTLEEDGQDTMAEDDEGSGKEKNGR
jgi:hypothetical protein